MSFRKANKTGASEIVPILIEQTEGTPDWTRREKIELSVDLTSGASRDLIFPEHVLDKIKKAQVPPISSLTGTEKGVVWFCIQEAIQKTTKNGKNFWRLKTIDDDHNITWVRVWGNLKQDPEPYTMWLAEVSSSESWGCSTTGWKMKRLTV